MAIGRVDLADLQQSIPVVDSGGLPTPGFMRYLNTVIRSLKNGVNSLIDVQNAIAAANAAVVVAQAAADTAIAAAATAQASADAAQATADAATPTTRTIATSGSMVTGDDGGTVLVDASAGAVTFTLLGANVVNFVTVKKIDSSANAVIIQALGGNQINHASSVTLTTQFSQFNVSSDGNMDFYA